MKYLNVNGIFVDRKIFRTKFSCDYTKCKGACCWVKLGVETTGAPLTHAESSELNEKKHLLEPYCSELEYKALCLVLPTSEYDGEETTTLASDSSCIFMNAKKKTCALKLAYADGKISFGIPRSCELYPITEYRKKGKRYLKYEEIFQEQCKCALEKGKREGIPLIEFLASVIKRHYGEEFYQILHAEQQKYK